jgi:hypothetical protein
MASMRKCHCAGVHCLEAEHGGTQLADLEHVFPLIPTKSQFEARLSISHLPEVNPELVILCPQLTALPF